MVWFSQISAGFVESGQVYQGEMVILAALHLYHLSRRTLRSLMGHRQLGTIVLNYLPRYIFEVSDQ